MLKNTGFHVLYNCCKETSRGGEAICLRESLQFKLRNDLPLFYESKIESIFVEATSGKATITVTGQNLPRGKYERTCRD